ncbi:unnamed protein product, partial [marine sediment metagenome]
DMDEKDATAVVRKLNWSWVSLPSFQSTCCRNPVTRTKCHIALHPGSVRAKVGYGMQLQPPPIAEHDGRLPSILDKAFKGEL